MADQSHTHAKTVVTAMLVTPADADPFLILEVTITCPECGDVQFQLGGHHTATLAAGLEKVLADHPRALTTLPVTEERQRQWQGLVPRGETEKVH